MGRFLAILALLAGAAHADNTTPLDLARVRFRVEVLGKFDTGGRDDVNRINAPPAEPRRPPPLDVPQLAAMNADLPRAVDETLRALGVKVVHDDDPPSCGSEFELTVHPAAPNDLGGRLAGNDVIVWARSPRQCEDAGGFGRATVAISADAKTQLANVRVALRAAIAQSLEALRALLAKPLVPVELRLETANLDGPQHAIVRTRVASCAARLASPATELAVPDEGTQVVRKLTLRVGRFEPQTEDQLLDWYAKLLPSIALGKGAGCLQGTTLDGWRAAAARTGRTIVVRFSRP